MQSAQRIDKMFYDRLIRLCTEKNIKITTVLKECEINTAYTKHWKEGKNPNIEHLIKLRRYFNVSIDYLLCLTDNPEINK